MSTLVVGDVGKYIRVPVLDEGQPMNLGTADVLQMKLESDTGALKVFDVNAYSLDPTHTDYRTDGTEAVVDGVDRPGLWRGWIYYELPNGEKGHTHPPFNLNFARRPG